MHWLRVDGTTGRRRARSPASSRCPACIARRALRAGLPGRGLRPRAEGLNLQVYNRCIGTRTCQATAPTRCAASTSSTTPRPRNTPISASSLQAQRNPDVTVRARGVMEKCTYCVQRIARARRDADATDRPIAPTRSKTACQAPARPARSRSATSPEHAAASAAASADPRHYALLGHLGTRPRTTYLADVRNPAPGLEEDARDAVRTLGCAAPLDRLRASTSRSRRRRRRRCSPPRGQALVDRLLGTASRSAVVRRLDRLAVRAGVGVWGNNTPVVWGFPIANYVWWIGIGNAGTLISAMLLLTRQKWRNSINRFAEAMTLFAVRSPGIYPIIHLGRPIYSTGWRPTPTRWALAAVAQPAGLGFLGHPEPICCFRSCSGMSASSPTSRRVRDRATDARWQLFFGVLALGWRGSAAALVRWSRSIRTGRDRGAARRLGASDRRPDSPPARCPAGTATVFPPYFVLGAVFPASRW